MVKLPKEDWEQLDILLGKMGFGGYYDVLEILKTTLINFNSKFQNQIKNENDIYNLIMAIYVYSEKVVENESKKV